MSQPRPHGSITFLAGAATVLFVAAILFGLFVLGQAVLGKGPGDIAIHQQIDGTHLQDVPKTVVQPDNVNVTVRVKHPTAHQRRIAGARDLAVFPVLLALLWIARAIFGSVRDGDPFTEENVRRLRIVGFVCLVGLPLTSYLASFFNSALADTTTYGLASSVNLSMTGPVVSVGVFALAELFAQGARLRMDVAGTV